MIVFIKTNFNFVEEEDDGSSSLRTLFCVLMYSALLMDQMREIH